MPRHLPKIKVNVMDRIDAVAHWQRVLRTVGLPQISYDSAIDGLKKLGAVRERVPGEDMEEEEQ